VVVEFRSCRVGDGRRGGSIVLVATELGAQTHVTALKLIAGRDLGVELLRSLALGGALAAILGNNLQTSDD